MLNVPGNSMNGPFSKRQGEWKSVQKACYIIEQISNGTGFLHSKDLVHRDINPSNSVREIGVCAPIYK